MHRRLQFTSILLVSAVWGMGLLLCTQELAAFDGGILRGFVTDSTNGESVIYANVFIRGTKSGATTSTSGYYLISAVPAGSHTVIISHIGYRPEQVTVTVRDNEITRCNVRLVPTLISLGEVSVVGEEVVRPTETGLGLQRISTEDIKLMPVTIESDLFRVLRSQPGVGSTDDVTSKYYVRGGGGDQNLVLLNGATVYGPFHALGIYSVIDPEMISMAEFYVGGFSPEYGGRLSSILNVVTRDGNKNNYHGTAQASLLSGKLSFEGPIPGGSVLVTGRKSYSGRLLKNYLNRPEAPFDFYDMSFKVNYSNPDIDENGKFVLHGFVSRDQLLNEDPLKEDYDIRNTIVGMNWHRVWSSPLYSRMNLSYSGFAAQVYPNLSKAIPRMNRVSDFTWDWDFTYTYDSRDELMFGVQNKFVATKLELDNLCGAHTSLAEHGWGLDCYVDYRFRRWDKFRLDLGVRPKLLALSTLRPFLFEPRVSLAYQPYPFVAFKAAVGVYSQEMFTLSDENELISIFEPWIITPDYLQSMSAGHLTAGMTVEIGDRLSIEIDGYYKMMANLVDANPKKFTAEAHDYVNVDGESYGLEFLFKCHLAGVMVQASYALSWAYKEREGKMYFPRYDSRHSANVLLGIELGEMWSANASWSLRSGMPFTPIAGYYDRVEIDPGAPTDVLSDIVPVTYWGEKNTARLPFYHRLDIGVSKKFQVSSADVTLGVSIVNVYDRKNVFYLDRDTGQPVYMLRFLPSATLKVEL